MLFVCIGMHRRRRRRRRTLYYYNRCSYDYSFIVLFNFRHHCCCCRRHWLFSHTIMRQNQIFPCSMRARIYDTRSRLVNPFCKYAHAFQCVQQVTCCYQNLICTQSTISSICLLGKVIITLRYCAAIEKQWKKKKTYTHGDTHNHINNSGKRRRWKRRRQWRMK